MLSVVGFFGREFDSPRLHHISLISAAWILSVWFNCTVVDIGFGQSSRGRELDFVQRLYSRFAFLALLAFLPFLEISNLRVLKARHGFDSRRFHQVF